jgi:signal peptidase
MIKKVLKLIVDIFLVFVIISAGIYALITFTSKKDGIPNIFGYSPFSIITPSMKPILNVGDIALCKKIDENTELNKGDIISFKTTIQGKNVIVTHRIESITTLDDKTVVISTKGDNNDASDANTITRDDVVAKYSGYKIVALGYLITFISNKYVFLCLVILPLAILFLMEFVDLIKDLVHNAEISQKEEEEKQKQKEKQKKENNKKKKNKQ